MQPTTRVNKHDKQRCLIVISVCGDEQHSGSGLFSKFHRYPRQERISVPPVKAQHTQHMVSWNEINYTTNCIFFCEEHTFKNSFNKYF